MTKYAMIAVFLIMTALYWSEAVMVRARILRDFERVHRVPNTKRAWYRPWELAAEHAYEFPNSKLSFEFRVKYLMTALAFVITVVTAFSKIGH